MVNLLIDELGFKQYLLNNKFHRLNGPTFVGRFIKSWFLNGHLIDCNSQEEFDRFVKLRVLW